MEKVELEVIEEQILHLDESIKKLENAITQAVQILDGYECLISIKGIGNLSAALLLSNIDDINNFKNPGKLASYFGMVPRINQSNNKCSAGRITKHGSKAARTSLIQCAIIAKQYNPYLEEFYQRIKARRGAGKAIVALARKFLNTVFYTLRDQLVFEDFPNYKIKSSV